MTPQQRRIHTLARSELRQHGLDDNVFPEHKLGKEMNERIKLLSEQAIEDMPGAWNIPDEFCKKFAELIVQECLNAIAGTNNRPSQESDSLMFYAGLFTAIDGIKEHFGVEE